MNPSFSSANALTSFSCDPKDLILNLKELVVAAMAGLSYSINTKGKGCWVAEVKGSGRWYDFVIGHKKITDKLVTG